MPGPSPVTLIWLEAQFESLHREHLLILKQLQEPSHVTPELEAQVRKAHKLSTSIDRKVPDKP